VTKHSLPVKSPTDESTFRRHIDRLVGKPCWSVVAGASTGSTVAIDIGDRVPRDAPLTNAHLSEDQKRYEAECIVFVECAWRLDRDGLIACGWQDFAENGDMPPRLRDLIGQEVETVEANRSGWDLILKLSGGLTLRLFNDAGVRGDDAYSVFVPGSIVTVSGNGRLTIESRTSA